MKRLMASDWFWRLLGAVLVLGTWEIYGRRVSPLLLPPLSRVLTQFWKTLLNGTLLTAAGQSMQLLIVGVTIGSLVGIVLGLIMGRYPLVGAVLDPYLHAVYASPRAAVIPLIILWFGLGFQGKAVIVFLTSFFEVLVATVAGVRHVSNTYIEVSRAFLLPDRQLFTKVIIPGAFSYIVSGIRLGVGHGLVGVVVSELFMETSGLGGLVVHGTEQFRTDRVMAGILLISMGGVAITGLLRWFERKVAPWNVETFE